MMKAITSLTLARAGDIRSQKWNRPLSVCQQALANNEACFQIAGFSCSDIYRRRQTYSYWKLNPRAKDKNGNDIFFPVHL